MFCVCTTAKTAINPHEPWKIIPSVGQKSNLTNHIDKAPKGTQPFRRSNTHTNSFTYTYLNTYMAAISLP